MDIDNAIQERFAKWGAFLRKESASPILMVALTADRRIVITSCEDISDGTMHDVLVIAARSIAAGEVERA
jgi:hypothetical protein